ncbi:MAG: T9SS type A sorting domain-containing protein [Chitinophagales bacterium]
MASFEATATISDSIGNLLFFTNGISIWDRNGIIMPHGDSLDIAQQQDEPYYGSSVTQGVIILPVPNSSCKYYVIYLTEVIDFYIELSLMYSMVDMTLNSGNGDVILGQKNVPITESGKYMWEKMTAVKHGNGKDWWFITISEKTASSDSCYFEKLVISETGISPPQFQPYDTVDVTGLALETAFCGLGQMKFSLSGKKLAVTRGSFIDVYDFDRCDGMLSNRIIVDSVNFENYGLEFSPDETKLYAASGVQTPVKPKLIQICLDCNVIIKTTLYMHASNYYFSQLQIAPDGKIYLGFAEEGFIDDNAHYLSVINYPDSFGTACDFELASFMLGDSAHMSYGLPNFVNYDLAALATPCDTADTTDIAEEIINKNEIVVFPNPAGNYITITSHFNQYTNTKAEMYNIAGVKVKEIEIQSSSQQINIKSLPAGIYSIIIKQNAAVMYNESLVKE